MNFFHRRHRFTAHEDFENLPHLHVITSLRAETKRASEIMFPLCTDTARVPDEIATLCTDTTRTLAEIT